MRQPFLYFSFYFAAEDVSADAEVSCAAEESAAAAASSATEASVGSAAGASGVARRIAVCLAVIAHLGARQETRWHSFAENMDYPEKSNDWLKYVNSRMEDGELKILYRELQ